MGRGHAPASSNYLLPTKQQPKPSVSVIGAGRLGQALALALNQAGYQVEALVARTTRKAQQAAKLLGKTTLALTIKQLDRLPSSGLFIIATPDDAIAATARAVSALGRSTGRIALHTSGALSSSAIQSLADAGYYTGSLHPLVSVSEPRAGAEALRGAFYCIEGHRKAQSLAKRIVSDLKGRSFSIRAADKPLYHAAAVMASPHLTALLDLSIQMLVACGLDRRTARQVLLPLVQSTVDNLKTLDTGKALTGTFARGDVATVMEHVKALAPRQHRNAREVYRLLGLHSLELARRNNLDPLLIKKIRALLNAE